MWEHCSPWCGGRYRGYQFCVSLPLEVRDSWSCSVSASPDSTLCFTLLAASRSCWACVQWQRVQCSRASQQPVSYTTQRRKCCLPPVPPLSTATVRHDLLSLETAAAPPHFLSPKLIARLSHLGIARKRAQKATPIEKRREEWTEEDQSDRRFSWSTFHPILPALQPHVKHTTSVPPSSPPSDRDDLSASSLRALLASPPLTDSCFTFPLVLPQPKTHSVSASSMQDPSALSRRRGPTYPLSFRTTTSTSCCWRRPGCALPVTRPRSPTWLRLGTRSSPSPALQGGPAQKAGESPSS